MNEWVLDASAFMAVLLGEPGADRVLAALPNAIVSAVNYAEVVGKLIERGVPEDVVRDSLGALSLDIVDFDADQAHSAGALRRTTRHLGLSLGDRACLALAMHRTAVALTTDSVWAEVDVGVKVELVR